MTTPFDKRVMAFNRSLSPGFPLPRGVQVMNPFRDSEVITACHRFYGKYYDDRRKRVFLFGINPGRHGAGVTGIPFTDPIRLETDCGIANPFRKVPELSSEFVYRVIGAYGGPGAFYRRFFITAVYPLGFLRQGKNLNYYDDRRLLEACRPDLVRLLRRQLSFGAFTDRCFCLGAGTNFRILESLNAEYGWFGEVVPLPHPRWVMQYRRKRVDEFVRLYLDTLAAKPRSGRG